MRRTFRAMGYGIARSLGGFRRRPATTLLTTCAVAASVLLLALVHLAASNVDSVTRSWGQGVEMVVYLDADATEDRASEIGAVLEGLPAVEGVTYVSQAEALDRLRGSLGRHDELADGIEVGMLPASLEVSLGNGVKDVAAAHPVIERLAETEGVEEVEFLGEWVSKLTALLKGLQATSLFLLLFVGGICVFVVAATIRLRMNSEENERHIYELVGASESFIRGPLLVEGTLHGIVGATLALVGLWALYHTGVEAVEDVLVSAFGAVSLSFLPMADLILFVCGAAGLGFLGSVYATRHHVSI